MGGKLRASLLIAGASIFLVNLQVNEVDGVKDLSCKDKNLVDIVYVRGSGEPYDGLFYKQINPELVRNINSQHFVLHELRPDLINNQNLPEYQAVAVINGEEGNSVGWNAIISHGNKGKYKSSVMSGKELLEAYIRQLSQQPDECLILLGYSQGAQVIGETLTDIAETYPGLLNRVIYVGLFGDPKLDLRGEGLTLGKNMPWYRGNALPLMSGGSLGSRIPYVPVLNGKYLGPVGSWCYDDDFVCTENYMALPTISAHSKYPERAFSQMSLEVANAINASVVSNDNAGVMNNASCRAGGQDVVVLLDTSPLMRRDMTLFTNTPMSDPHHTNSQGLKLPPRTAGQMITESSCNDTRVAVVGYGRPSDGPPRLLLNFTKNARSYDDLMKSLYEPSATGTHERTQFREGTLFAMDLDWRQGANRTIFSITNSVGSGPEWASGSSKADQMKRSKYMTDALTQRVIDTARSKDIAMIGHGTRSSYHGFVWDSTENPSDHRKYLDTFAAMTGGYNWVREWPNYSGYSYKLTRLAATLEEAFERRGNLYATAITPRMKEAELATLEVEDTVGRIADAKNRGEAVSYRWYVTCNDRASVEVTSEPSVSFVPSAPGSCTGAVTIETKRITGGGCYSGCPEPYPSKYLTMFPIKLNILPKDYVPKVPGPIRNLQKYIHSSYVVYEWDAAEYNGSESPVYVIKDSEGFVLAASTQPSLTITDITDEDPVVNISVHGRDGKSGTVSSSEASVIDMRIDPIGSVDLPYYVSDEEPELTGGSERSVSDASPLNTSSETPQLGTATATFDAQTVAVVPEASSGIAAVQAATTQMSSDLMNPLESDQKVSSDSAFASSTSSRGDVAKPLFVASAIILLTIIWAVFMKKRIVKT